ncbi:hypothetical protein CTheo_1584 [Ceratobasidium theobromae]|uniref:Rxt3-domain-containing protein n=1 Tax=Ceratobasidium theobromae TaxID=1582974 RepID=A0A5N5QTP7_9AGAM|nr:hypothetical protein CTheo_1584 [Ceratobasidium theobromae]
MAPSSRMALASLLQPDEKRPSSQPAPYAEYPHVPQPYYNQYYNPLHPHHHHHHVHVIHSHPATSPPFAAPRPIVPITPRSPVAPYAARSPSAPYPIYGAGALTGRRTPEYSPHASGSRRTLGPQAIEPVNLRELPYPNEFPTLPPFAYPESPHATKRRSGPTAARPPSKRSIDVRPDRSRERDERDDKADDLRERLDYEREMERRKRHDDRRPEWERRRREEHIPLRHAPHSTHPALALVPLLPPLDLGTHVFPNLPFPVCLPPSLGHSNLGPDGYRPYHYTILIPTGFLPLQPATRSPRPALPLWGGPTTGYTDDSNLLLAAVHSARITWSDIRRARKLKQDAKITVGVWVGGANGGRNATRPKGGPWEGGQGAGQLFSSSWGNTHDGGGMEIVQVEWIEGAAHAPHRPNRRDRMEQYAMRRADLDLLPPVKRDRIDTWYLDSDDDDPTPARPTWDPDTIVFGNAGTTSGFVYDPHALRSVVFQESNERSTKRLKPGAEQRDILLENDDEQYILTLNNDKVPRTYTLLTLSPRSKKTEVLRNSLTEQDVAFFDKGLCVWLKDGVATDQPIETDRKGWFCHVNRWKFAPQKSSTDVL